jgi:hypothetical protein
MVAEDWSRSFSMRKLMTKSILARRRVKVNTLLMTNYSISMRKYGSYGFVKSPNKSAIRKLNPGKSARNSARFAWILWIFAKRAFVKMRHKPA